jgi:UDP-N-acetylmuramyl pentapeptide synthase
MTIGVPRDQPNWKVRVGELTVELDGSTAACLSVSKPMQGAARHIADAARASGKVGEVRSFATTAEAGEYLAGAIQHGDAVLVKGSQGSRMERVTKAIIAYPSRSAELLVRQTDYWLAKE